MDPRAHRIRADLLNTTAKKLFPHLITCRKLSSHSQSFFEYFITFATMRESWVYPLSPRVYRQEDHRIKILSSTLAIADTNLLNIEVNLQLNGTQATLVTTLSLINFTKVGEKSSCKLVNNFSPWFKKKHFVRSWKGMETMEWGVEKVL